MWIISMGNHWGGGGGGGGYIYVIMASLSKFHTVHSLWPRDAIWHHESWSNIGSDNGLWPDGTKALPKLMMTQVIDASIKMIANQDTFMIAYCVPSVTAFFVMKK